MATYLYGLLLARNASSVPPSVRGLHGSAARVITCGDVGALVGTANDLQGSLDEVKAHDGALQAVVDAGVTIAAARFRQLFAHDEEACAHVSESAARTIRLLQDQDGCVEMRLLVAGGAGRSAAHEAVGQDVAAVEPSGVGRAYLERLREEHNVTARLSLKQRLGTAVRAERIEILRTDSVTFAHLVHREELAAYRTAVATSGIRATVLGPLALYSFAEPGT